MEKKQKAPALIVGTANIDKAIASIKNRGAKLDGDIQMAGLSILTHVDQHGDTGVADRLFNAMPNGARRLALVEWMLAFAPMRLLTKEEAKATADRTFQLDRTKKLDMEGAQAKAWHEFRKEKAVQDAFDAQAAVASLLARLNAASKGGKTIENKAQAVEQAKALLAVLKGGAE